MNNIVEIYLENGVKYTGELLETYPWLNKKWLKLKTRRGEMVINMLAINTIHYPDNHPNKK